MPIYKTTTHIILIYNWLLTLLFLVFCALSFIWHKLFYRECLHANHTPIKISHACLQGVGPYPTWSCSFASMREQARALPPYFSFFVLFPSNNWLKTGRDIISLNFSHTRVVSQRRLVVSGEILWYLPCSGSLVWFHNFESLRTFGREYYKCSIPSAVANSHAAG